MCNPSQIAVHGASICFNSSRVNHKHATSEQDRRSNGSDHDASNEDSEHRPSKDSAGFGWPFVRPVRTISSCPPGFGAKFGAKKDPAASVLRRLGDGPALVDVQRLNRMTDNSATPTVESQSGPRIVVVGLGGAGGNAVDNMIRAKLEGVEFVVANTDAQALEQSACARRVQLGRGVTRGLGAGSRPEVGRAATEESLGEIVSAIEGAQMVFITAGMGGGTGGPARCGKKAASPHAVRHEHALAWHQGPELRSS